MTIASWKRALAACPTRKKPRSTAETKLQSAILEALAREPGVSAYRNRLGASRRRGQVVFYGLGEGSADIICCVGPRGRLLALEVKLPGEDAEPNQREWGVELMYNGGVYAIVRSVDDARRWVRYAREH